MFFSSVEKQFWENWPKIVGPSGGRWTNCNFPQRKFVQLALLIRSRTCWKTSTKVFRAKLDQNFKAVFLLREKFVQSVLMRSITVWRTTTRVFRAKLEETYKVVNFLLKNSYKVFLSSGGKQFCEHRPKISAQRGSQITKLFSFSEKTLSKPFFTSGLKQSGEHQPKFSSKVGAKLWSCIICRKNVRPKYSSHQAKNILKNISQFFFSKVGVKL